MRKLIKTQYFVSFILGAIAALTFAPVYLFPLAIVGFSGLFLLIDKEQSEKKTFWLGWSFGFGHFVIGFYWISISLLVDIVKFGWLIPFAVSLIPATAAVYIGLVALLTNKVANYLKLEKLQKIIIFCIFWIFFEYLRSILFSGFPWNLIGYSLVFSTSISQIASVVGIYGLSLLAVLLFTLPAMLIEICQYNLKFSDNSKKNFYIIFSLIFVVVAVSVWGGFRISSTKLTIAKNGNVRIVQPSIEQKHKWDPSYKYKSFVKNIHLSTLKDNEDINYLIWSESAIPYLIDEHSVDLLSMIKEAVPKNGFLVSGALRANFNLKGKVDEVFNSIFTVNDKGNIVDIYDKRHLVPFGEYIPFGKYIPFVSKITDGSTGFSSGDEFKTIKPNKNIPSFNPLICYEVIFSNLIKNDKEHPDFLINLTNDAWFGRSSGPYQHLAMARVRAIEYGLPLVRAANNGVSAYIDPYGRIVKKIPLNKIDAMDIKLVEKLETTLYDAYGIKILSFIIILMLLPLILSKYKNASRTKSNRCSPG